MLPQSGMSKVHIPERSESSSLINIIMSYILSQKVKFLAHKKLLIRLSYSFGTVKLIDCTVILKLHGNSAKEDYKCHH